MEVSTLLWLTLAAIAISIFISYKFKSNIGIPAFVFAYIIGCWIQGYRVKEVVAGWPASTIFQLMTITMFFSFAVANETLPLLAKKMLYKVRKKAWLIPFMLLFIGAVIGACGAPPPAVNAILAVLTFTLAAPAGLNPYVCIVIVVFGGSIGTWFPWAVQGSVVTQTTEGWLAGLGETTAWKVVIAWIILTLVLFFITWIFFKGYKTRAIEMEEPPKFNDVQKKNLIIIAIVAVLVILPNLLKIFLPASAVIKKLSAVCDIQMLSLVGVLVCGLMKLGSEKDAIVKGVPWGTITQVGGVCTLMAVATKAGVVDFLASKLSDSVNYTMMIVILSLLGSFLSLFSGAINAVYPMLGTIAVGYASASGANPVPLLVAIAIGASATAVSPFSTGGAIMIASCPDKEMRDGLFNKSLIMAIVAAALSAVLGLVGVYSI